MSPLASRTRFAPFLLAVLAVAFLAPGSAAAGEDPADEGRRQVRAVFVGDGLPGDLKVLELEGLPDHLQWVEDHRLMGKGGFLGVFLTPLTPELQSHFGAPEGSGVLVSKVLPDTAAAAAGVQVGDLILAVDGEAVAGPGELARAVSAHEPGTTVSLEVLRDGRRETLSATLARHEGAVFPAGDFHKRIKVIHCEGDDCAAAGGALPCGNTEDCRVVVQCKKGGDCDCRINGEEADCAVIPGVPHQR